APEPPHSRHAVSSWTGIFVSRPFRESSNERLTSTSTSFPRWVWARCGPAPRPRLKIPPRKSPRSPKSMLSLLNPPPPKLKFPGPGRPSADPNASYCLRFPESESTSYAPWISLKRSSAAGSFGLRSGWFSRASFRYAFLISSCEADLETPRTPYRSLVLVAIRLLRGRDDDTRRSQHALSELVALLEDLDYRALVRLRRLGQARLADVRVELAVGLDLREPLTLEQ